MIKSILAACLFLAAGLAFDVGAQQGRDLPDFTQIVEQHGASVVNISTTQARPIQQGQARPPQLDENDPFYDFFRRFVPRSPQGPREFESQSLGSGFIISADGYILTNSHVVDSADEITVKLNDKREYKARVIGADRRTDVALIKIEANGLRPVTFGDPNTLRVGEWVLAIGSPFGFENTVTAGIVSAKGRSLPQENFVPFLQTDVAINPGNSGGPLFNLRGEVVGINSQIYSRTGGFMGLSFAIPIDVAMDVQNQLRTSGRVSRGRIGVVIQEVTKELADSFGLDRPRGALVNAVEKGGPADKAGVETGDIILSFNGKDVESSMDLPRIVAATRPGTSAGMQVWRKAAARPLTVSVGEIPDEKIAGVPAPKGPEKPVIAANRLGLVVSDLPQEKRRELNLKSGVLVDEVRGEPRGDVRPGDVILALTAKGVTTDLKDADQFNKVLAKLEKGTTLTLQIRRGEINVFATIKGEPRG
jgi:serine protease Do